MSFSTGSFPVSLNGRNIGSVTIAQEGLLTVFECACPHDGLLTGDPERVPRLAAVCAGRLVPLGVMIPQGGTLHLKKKFSKNALLDIGYQDTDTFVLVTKRELDAAQRAAAPSVHAPPEAGKKPAEGAPPAPAAAVQNEALQGGKAPAPPPEADASPAPAAAPAAVTDAAPPKAAPAADKTGAPAVDKTGAPAAPAAPGEAAKGEKSTLNAGSNYPAPDMPPEKCAEKADKSFDKSPDFAGKSTESEQIPEPPDNIPSDARAPAAKADAADAGAAAGAQANAGNEALNDGSKLIEALAPALGKLFSALSAQNAPSPETDARQDAPFAPPNAQAAGEDGSQSESGAPAQNYSGGNVYQFGGDAQDAGKSGGPDPSGGGAPDAEAFDKPLIGGWQPAPPLTQLFEDPTIYEGHELIPGALVTEQDGFTLLAVPVSPDEPFALMNIFCFGYPTQIAEKDYILFKVKDGALAL